MLESSKSFINVTSETGTLRRLLVHSPDSGLGKVVPSKAQDWLFEDIVHLDSIRRKEYDYYTKLLFYFLEPEKIKGKLKEIDHPNNKRAFYKPGHPDFHKSDKIIEIQWLLSQILEDNEIRLQLIASVCAIEACSFETQQKLKSYTPEQLSRIFISGTHSENEMIFPPLPNLIFTRDIGITINEYILLNKPAKKARTREALLLKYIFYHHPIFTDYKDKIIELPDTHHHFLLPKDAAEHKVTLEGGDVMTVSKNHVLVGVSERTSWEAAYQTIKILFEKNVVEKITVVKIPRKRDYMHIDTVFTQVKKNIWVMLGNFSEKFVKGLKGDSVEKYLDLAHKKDDKLKIIQFRKDATEQPVYFESLEELLINISVVDLGCKKEEVKFIFSGNNEFPYDAREQWTDSCNLLALKEGVVIGYDRNDKTLASFKDAGFNIVKIEDLIDQLEQGIVKTEEIENTVIITASSELSRARGGFHCMSMPLLRD